MVSTRGSAGVKKRGRDTTLSQGLPFPSRKSPRVVKENPKKVPLKKPPVKALTQQKFLDEDEEDELFSSSSEEVPKEDKPLLVAAQDSLHLSSAPSRPIGRDDHINFMKEAITQTVEAKKSKGFYISGLPGTGKSLTMSCVLKDLRKSLHEYAQFAYVNAMKLSKPQDLYQQVLMEFNYKSFKCNTAQAEVEQKLVFTNKKQKITVLVVDEIDRLLSSGQEILYTLYGWPILANARIIVVGIANALDMTERFLPRLNARNCSPTLINFKPYDKKDIGLIVKNRLEPYKTSEGKCVVDEPAIMMCAARVGGSYGDVRKALDLCKRALSIAHSKSENGEGRVTVRDMAAVLREAFGATTSDRIAALPEHQLIVLCCAVRALRSQSLTRSIKSLYEEYKKDCMYERVPFSDRLSYIEQLEGISGSGFLGLGKPNLSWDKRLVTNTCNWDDLEYAVSQKAIVARFLSGGAK